MRRQNVLMIVVDQWRGDCVPHVQRADGHQPILRTPNLDRLCREGTTFRNHVTTTVPCGPARASLLTGLYQMNHRACQNTVPLDVRHDTLPKCTASSRLRTGLGRLHHHRVPTRAPPGPRTHASPCSATRWTAGVRSASSAPATTPISAGWPTRATSCPPTATISGCRRGRTRCPAPHASTLRASPPLCRIRAYFTERALTYLKGRDGLPFFLHLGYYRPHPPFVASAPYHAMYSAADMKPPVRAANAAAEAAQHPLLHFYLENSRITRSSSSGAEGMVTDAGRGRHPRQMRATYFGMMTEVDDQIGRVFAWLDETGQWGRHAGRVHLRPWRATRRPSPAGQGRLFRRELPHSPGDQGAWPDRAADRGRAHREHRRDADHAGLAGRADPKRLSTGAA